MREEFERTRMLLGDAGMERLSRARVAIFGIGGVGGYAAEALARSGVGALVLVDSDRISTTNINRQIIATAKTVGQYKVDVMRERIADINPDAVVETHRCFFLPENADEFDFSQYSYVVDAVDTVTAKIEIILRAQAAKVPVISSMGTGNKLDPTRLEIADIYQTSMCPLAKVMRHELKKRGVQKLKVVYSTEPPVEPETCRENCDVKAGNGTLCDGGEESGGNPLPGKECGIGRRAVPGSTAFVPPAAGLILAGEVVRELTRENGNRD